MKQRFSGLTVFVDDKRDGLYKDWWKGDKVHFGGAAADALGHFLGEMVLEELGR